MFKSKNILFFATLLVLSISLITYSKYKEIQDNTREMPYTEFTSLVEEGQVTLAEILDSDKIRFELQDNSKNYYTENPRTENFKEYLLLNNVKVSEGNDLRVVSVLQTVMAAAFLMFMVVMSFKLFKGRNKSESSLEIEAFNPENTAMINFDSIAGNEEAKESVEDIVDFIKNPQKFADYGARMPRGVILYGPPGTGKTLLAKAIASEAEVPFYSVSGSDFVQMYVGVGASRIRELFNKARSSSKAVIFIDEIDAIGKKRSMSVSGSNEEKDQTLNALLTEMCGFSTTEGIIVIAATNRLDMLDEALLRPGRFDRQVEIGLPDKSGREKILRKHLLNKPTDSSIDIKKISEQTVYFSGAMLESMVNEAAISAAKNERKAITYKDIETAFYTAIAGSEKKDRSSLNQEDRKISAYHEAGHAVVSRLIEPENRISKITIIPSTRGAGGFCVNIKPERMFLKKREIENQIMISYAGRAAEEIIFGKENVTTGAYNDIERASKLLADYVDKYGMHTKGLLSFNAIGHKNSNTLEDCIALSNELYEKTKTVIIENIELVRKLANLLLENETLDECQINELF